MRKIPGFTFLLFVVFALTASSCELPGTFNFQIPTASVTEGESVTLTVSRDAGTDGVVSVDYTTVDGSATAGVDYIANSGTLTWASEDGSNRTITVNTTDDTNVENDETFSVELSSPTGGADLGSEIVTITIQDDDQQQSNGSPTADAGSDQTVAVGNSVTLDGSASSDPDGDPLSYVWSFSSQPAGSSATLSNTTAVTPSFAPDVAGDYVVKLTVSDGQAQGTDTVTVTATSGPPPSNSSPNADAGSDQTVTVGSSVTLDGGASSDPDSDPLSYVWSFSSQPADSSATLSDTTAVAPSFTPDVAGDYVVELTVSDGQVQDTDAVTVTATDTTPPPPSELEFSLTSFPVGNFPASVAIGDLDEDGSLDLAVANFDSNDVSVLLNDGSGNFSAASNLMAGNNPRSVAIGDLDGDGSLDLAVANLSSEVSVFLNNGSGNFGPVNNFSVGIEPASVAIGDLNGDGSLDLAIADFFDDNVSVLLNDGSGTFDVVDSFPVGVSQRSVAIGDLNGDGNLDLVVTNFNESVLNSSVSVLLNDGSGNFGSVDNFVVGSEPFFVATGDLNGDGSLDLAVTNLESNDVSVLLNDGSGNFNAASNFAVGDFPIPAAIGDLDGDGDLDLAVGNYNSDEVSVLLNGGSGNFGAANNFVAGDFPTSVAIGDLDGDGNLDLVVANGDEADSVDSTNNTISVLLQVR